MAAARGEIRERRRRDRASTPPLRTMYPQFVSLRLNFEFSDRGPFTPVPQSTVLHPPAHAYFVFPCPYSDCSGEFDLSSIVAGVAMEGRSGCGGQLRCGGQRNREQGGQMPCDLTLEYTIEVQRA